MKVAVGSMFRDSGQYVRRTLFEQMHGLAELLKARGDEAAFVFVENDSTDDTFYWLNEFAACGFWPTVLVNRHDDCPYFPSVDRIDRWRHLAWVANGTLEELAGMNADRFLYVESDLKWEPADLLRLVDQADGCAMTAQNVQEGGHHFDTWGTRASGIRFGRAHPYHHEYSGELMRVESSCGATALPASVAAECRFQPEDCYVGFNRQIIEKGLELWLDPTIKVVHP